MGALVSVSQRDDVRDRIRELESAGARIVAGDPDAEPPVQGGAFLPPVLLRPMIPGATTRSMTASRSASVDDHARTATSRRGRARQPRRGSLCLSLFTIRATPRATSCSAPAPNHGRMLVIDRTTPPKAPATASPCRC
jgi:oxepin-CoA hydrolase/3-oxo-5,6-dehydrosuberyl-CoA semialdehyde dehydrogenase